MASALPTGMRAQALALAMLAALLGAAWLAVVSPLLDWHAAQAETLQQRRTLADRMEAVVATLPRLRQEAAGAGSVAAPQALLEGASDAIAGAALQGQLEAQALGSGVALSSAEMLPVQAAGAYRRVSLRIAVGGQWPELVSLLQAIETARPRMLIDDLQVQPAPTVTGGAAQPLSAIFTVTAFRAGTAP